MSGKIYKIKIVRGHKPRRGEPISNSYIFFVHTLNILKDLNKILPQSFEKYKEDLLKQHREQISILDQRGKKELAKYLSFLKNTTRKNFRAGTLNFTNRKLVNILKEQDKLFLYSIRFNMFIREMSLAYLITEFEQFLGRALSITFEKFPNRLMTAQKNVSYEEVLSSKQLDDLKAKIIDREVNGVIAQDIDEITKYLKDKFGFDMSSSSKYGEFKERFYRRNIVIHNNCYPDEKYRKRSGYKGPSKRMSITQGYLTISINLFRNFALVFKNSLEKRTGIKIG